MSFYSEIELQSTVNGKAHSGARISTGELAAEAVQSAQRLVSLELALAKQELREMLMANLIGAACIAAAGLLAILALLVAVPVIVVFLVPWHWQAAVVWAIAYALVGGGLGLYGRSRICLQLPAKTLDSLKENKEWVLRQIRSTSR